MQTAMELRERSAGEFFVQRDVLDELDLDKLAQKKTHSTKQPVAERVKDYLRCSGPRLKRTVLGCVPVLSWLPHYNIRENGVGDLISGISVGIMHLPQGMAYALLASLPPVFGLYTSLYPVLVYFIFGTSRHISVGTFAVISIMIGSVTERLAPDSAFQNLTANGTTGGLNVEDRDVARVQIAVAMTVLTGLFQILLGLVRFGFVVTYLSEPLIRGYTTGAACHVTISQVKYLFGIKPDRFAGPLSQVWTLLEIFSLLGETKVAELCVSLVSLVVLIVVKELNACYSKKLPLPIPIELIVIIGATIISYYANLPADYAIDVVGQIPSGLVAPRVPDVSLFSEVIGDAFAVAIVAYAISISLGKTFALKHGYKVDSNQELVALGLSNTIGGFFQCYCVTSSLSRSLIQESTGGKTQIAGVVSSIIVLITVLKLGSLFEDLPKAVLATIVFVNLKGMFRQFLDVPALWKSNKVDLVVWLVTFSATLLLNLDIGLAVAIAFCILTVIFKTQLPHYSILGQLPGTELYLDTDTYEEAKPIPGITIFRSSTTVYYTNAEMYLEALQEKSGIDLGKLLEQKKKRAAKLKRQGGKEKKKAKEEAKKKGGGNIQLNKDKFSSEESERNQWKPVNGDMKKAESQTGDVDLTETPANGHTNLAFHHDENAPESDSHGADGDREKDGAAAGSVRHSVILDLSTTSFVDTVTVKTLKNIFRDFGEIDVDIYLAACQACVVEQLDRASFFSESVPKSRLFATVHDAVLHVARRTRRRRSLADEVTAYHGGEDDCAVDISCITKL